MKKRLVLSCLFISCSIFLSCTNFNFNTINTDYSKIKDSTNNKYLKKDFSTKSFNSIKVPNLPNRIYSSSYLNDMFINSSGVSFRAWGSGCSICKDSNFVYNSNKLVNDVDFLISKEYPPISNQKYNSDGFNLNEPIYDRYENRISTGYDGISIFGDLGNVIPLNLEIGKEYYIPFEFVYMKAYELYSNPESGKVFIRFDKESDSKVKVSLIAENLLSPIKEECGYIIMSSDVGSCGTDSFGQTRIDSFEFYSYIDTTYDELTLNVDKTELTSDSDKVNISVASSSDTRDWVVKISTNLTLKTVSGRGNQSLSFPASDFPDGISYISVNYIDQSYLAILNQVTKQIDSNEPYMTDTEYRPYGKNTDYGSFTLKMDSGSSCQY